jgi:hypothetical protein
VLIRDDAIIERMERFTAALYVAPGTIGNVFIEGPPVVDVFILDDDGEWVVGREEGGGR